MTDCLFEADFPSVDKICLQNCMRGIHSLLSDDSIENTKLRCDGVYLQLGNRKWVSGAGDNNSKHWYNIMRVSEDFERLVFLGTSNKPFYYRKKLKKIYGKYNRNMRRIFLEFGSEESDLENPIKIAQGVAKMDFRDILYWGKSMDNIELWSMSISKLENCWCGLIEREMEDMKTTIIATAGHCFVNDSLKLYYEDEPLILKDFGSACREEYKINNETSKYGINYDIDCHNFPMYFVPNDLSHKDIWEEPVKEWMSK